MEPGNTAARRLGAAIVRYRRLRGLSQRDLAKRLHMSGHGGLGDYENGRRVPKRELTVRLEQALGVQDGELQRLREAAVAWDSVPPAELPATPSDFRGRTDELSLIGMAAEAVLRRGQPEVVVLTGHPGMGKTTLAASAGARAAAMGLADAQFFVELRGMSGDPLAPDDALGRLLYSLGVAEDRMPPDSGARAALCRSLLARLRAVLVLDDARSEAQVRPLLPGGGWVLVLVTSRRQLAGLPGARHVQVGTLPNADAAALLADIAGPDRMAGEPGAAEEVVRACGGLPLALRIAGNLLAVRPQWTVAGLADRLRDEHARLSVLKAGDLQVRGAFALSYREASEPLRRLFRLLALVPAPDFGGVVAGELIGEPAGELLEELAGAGLVAPTAMPGRYRFHDLMRLYAAECLAEEDTADIATALHRWLLGTAGAAAAAVAPPPATGSFPCGRQEALAWLDAELPAVLGAAAAAARRADGALDGCFPDLVDKMAWYSDLRCRWQDLIELSGHALLVADRAGDLVGRASALNALGMALAETQRNAEGIERLGAALAAARAAGDWYQEAEAHGKLGVAYRGLGRYREAADCHQDKVRVCHVHGYRLGESSGLGHLGFDLYLLGELDTAAAALVHAITLRTELGDRRGVAMNEYRLGAVRCGQGRPAEAARLLDSALASFVEFDDAWGIAATHCELGRAWSALGRVSDAVTALRTGIDGLAALGDRFHQSLALRSLADIHDGLGDATAARAARAQADTAGSEG